MGTVAIWDTKLVWYNTQEVHLRSWISESPEEIIIWLSQTVLVEKPLTENNDQVSTYLHLSILSLDQEMCELCSKLFQNSCFEKQSSFVNKRKVKSIDKPLKRNTSIDLKEWDLAELTGELKPTISKKRTIGKHTRF